MKIARAKTIAKFLVALGGACTGAAIALADGSISPTEALTIVTTFGAAVGVWRIPNAPLD